MVQQQNKSNLQLIDDLKSEKDRLIKDLKQKEKELAQLYSKLMQSEKEQQHEKERAQQFERHIKELKEQEGQRMENVTNRWEQNVSELTQQLQELQGFRHQFQERDDVFEKLKSELNDCTKEMDKTKEEKAHLLQRLEDLKAEVKMLQT